MQLVLRCPRTCRGENYVLKKRLLLIGGTLSLGLGIVGMLVPVLPTTPFLLLTAYCYLRSSERMHAWLMNHRLFGSYIHNYMEYRAISSRARIISLIGLWASLAVSFILVAVPAVRWVLVLVGVGVSVHLLMLKTMPKAAQGNADHMPDPAEREDPTQL